MMSGGAENAVTLIGPDMDFVFETFEKNKTKVF